jgi:aerobic-type carbon monoxide dehydrogenase small subunit (CoxS/CutS family)
MTTALKSPPHVTVHCTVDGEERDFLVGIHESIFDWLHRDGYVAAKNGCLDGTCGACAIELNGRAVLACAILAAHADGGTILTAAGLGRPGALDPLQEAFLEAGGVQCGFCTPGLLIAARHLLRHNPDPTDAEIRAGLAGNLCRCTGYMKPVEAVRLAAKRQRQASSGSGR